MQTFPKSIFRYDDNFSKFRNLQIFLISNGNLFFRYASINELYLPDVCYEGKSYDFQQHLNDSGLKFLSNEYFKFDAVTNKKIKAFFEYFEIKTHADIIDNIHLHLKEQNINYFIDCVIEMGKIHIFSRENFNIKIKSLEFSTENNKNQKSSKKLLKDLFVPCPFFNYEELIEENIFLSTKYLNNNYEERVKLFKECGLKDHNDLYSESISHFMNKENNISLIKALILTLCLKLNLQQSLFNNSLFNNIQTHFLKSILFRENFLFKNFSLLTEGEKRYLISDEIYRNDLLSDENDLKLEQILNLKAEDNLFLSQKYFEFEVNTVSSLFRDKEDYEKFKALINPIETSNLFFKKFLTIKKQTELICICEQLVNKDNCVNFLKEIFFYINSEPYKKNYSEHYPHYSPKRLKNTFSEMPSKNEVINTLKEKKIFLNKDSIIISSSNIYLNDELNREMKLENYLPNEFILNASYKLKEEEESKIKEARNEWIQFLLKLKIMNKLNWFELSYESFDDIATAPYILQYFIEQVSKQAENSVQLIKLFKDGDHQNKSKENFDFNVLQKIDLGYIENLSFYEICNENSDFASVFIDYLFSKSDRLSSHLNTKGRLEIILDDKKQYIPCDNFMIWFLNNHNIIPSSIGKSLQLHYFYDRNLISSKNEYLSKIFPIMKTDVPYDVRRILNLKTNFDINAAFEILIEILSNSKKPDDIDNLNNPVNESIDIKELFNIFYDILLDNRDEFFDLEKYKSSEDKISSVNEANIKILKGLISKKINFSNDLNKEKEQGKSENEDDNYASDLEVLLLSGQETLVKPEKLFFIDIDLIDYSDKIIDDKVSIYTPAKLKESLRKPSNMKKLKEILRQLGVTIIDKDNITIKSNEINDISANSGVLDLKKYFLEKLLIYSCYIHRNKTLKNKNKTQIMLTLSGDEENNSQEKRIINKFKSITDKFSLKIKFYQIEDKSLQFYYENELIFEDDIFIRKSAGKATDVFIANIDNPFNLKKIKTKIMQIIKDEILEKSEDLEELNEIVDFDENPKILEFYLSKEFIESQAFDRILNHLKDI